MKIVGKFSLIFNALEQFEKLACISLKPSGPGVCFLWGSFLIITFSRVIGLLKLYSCVQFWSPIFSQRSIHFTCVFKVIGLEVCKVVTCDLQTCLIFISLCMLVCCSTPHPSFLVKLASDCLVKTSLFKVGLFCSILHFIDFCFYLYFLTCASFLLCCPFLLLIFFYFYCKQCLLLWVFLLSTSNSFWYMQYFHQLKKFHNYCFYFLSYP